ncbi:HNH endonuclease [Streptomyces sp. I5]
MIEAAHLRGDADGGSSDARNVLPMNAALHRAFDAPCSRSTWTR